MHRDLGEGLRLRAATDDDIESLVAFNAAIHHPGPDGEPNPRIAARSRSWLDGTHPVVRPADFTLVEEVRTGRVVSSCALFSQVWHYAGIPLPVGQIEFVGTDPAWRGRGLVRAQFAALHQRSVAGGHLLQAITGIPHFYRQFGYALALDNGGGRRGDKDACMSHVAGEYRIRPATHADIPFLLACDELGRRRVLLSAERDEALWRYEIDGRRTADIFRRSVWIVTTEDARPLGFVAFDPQFVSETVTVYRYELMPEAGWLDVTPAVWQALARVSERARALSFWLGTEHPVYTAFPRTLPVVEAPATWYVRVPDLVDFLRRITPALEQHLAQSPARGYSGLLQITTYPGILTVHLRDGVCEAISAEAEAASGATSAAIPLPLLTHLLTGHKSLDELRAFDADCVVEDEGAYVVLNALFPKQPSGVWALG
jgi:hypothetical protein